MPFILITYLKKMSKGFFTDKNSKPAGSDIINTVGTAKANWDFILHRITKELKLKGDLKFYGINYGWALRFKKNGRSVAALYPGRECFTVQIILNKGQAEFSLLQDLDEKTVKTIKDTKSIHEGKWIFLKIDNKTDLKDIFKLINIRIKVK